MLICLNCVINDYRNYEWEEFDVFYNKWKDLFFSCLLIVMNKVELVIKVKVLFNNDCDKVV